MKRLRTLLFWGHLTAGTLAGIVIFVMSFTGAALALKPQIQNWIDRDVRFVAPQEAPRLSARHLLSAVVDAQADASPQSIAFDRDPDVAVNVNLGPGGSVYLNPYTGAILGSGSAAANQFFQSLTSWHRYLGTTGEYRNLGRSATGASNLAFLVLGLTGLYLWWPRQLSVRHVKPALWFRRTSTGRAREFNWHNVIGFWCLPAIIIMAGSGVVLSYAWGNALVYRLTGSPLPAARGIAPAGNAAAQRPEAGLISGRRADGVSEAHVAIPSKLDQMVARAEELVPTWSQLSLRLPNRDGGPVSLTITDGAQWNAFARSQLTLNGSTGEIVQWQPYDGNNLGQKVRGWLRFAHTGELGGLTGQIIAGIGCLGGMMLVYTGLSLAMRRLWNWSLWARLPVGQRLPYASTAPGTVTAQRDAVLE